MAPQCDQCPLAFYYKAGLEEHVKRVHLKLKDTGTSFRPLHIRIVFVSVFNLVKIRLENIALFFWSFL